MTDRDLMQQALEALAGLLKATPWADHPQEAYSAERAYKALWVRLAQPEPVSHSGIKIWIGNKQVVQHLTQTQLHHAIDPWMLFEMTVGKCIAALKEKNND